MNKPGKIKLISYLAFDYQQNTEKNNKEKEKDIQRKTNGTNIKRKTSNKKSNNMLKTIWPMSSPNKNKQAKTLNSSNKIVTSLALNNVKNLNFDMDLKQDKIERNIFSKASEKHSNSIKHNKE